MGLPIEAPLKLIPESHRAYNADRSWVLGWYVSRHDEDRYDETTVYTVGLFDAKTEEQLNSFTTSVHERNDTGSKEGEHLESAAFDEKDDWTVILRYDDGSETRTRVDAGYESLDRDPEKDFGVVMSGAEKRIRERLRVRRDELLKKLQRTRGKGDV